MDANPVCVVCNGTGQVQIFIAGHVGPAYDTCICRRPKRMTMRPGMTFPEYEISRPKSSYPLLKAEVD